MTWAEKAAEAIARLAASGVPFTSDDLIAAVGLPDKSHAPNSLNNGVGAVFARASRDGLIRVTGHAASTLPTRKGGLVRVWSGVAA